MFDRRAEDEAGREAVGRAEKAERHEGVVHAEVVAAVAEAGRDPLRLVLARAEARPERKPTGEGPLGAGTEARRFVARLLDIRGEDEPEGRKAVGRAEADGPGEPLLRLDEGEGSAEVLDRPSERKARNEPVVLQAEVHRARLGLGEVEFALEEGRAEADRKPPGEPPGVAARHGDVVGPERLAEEDADLVRPLESPRREVPDRKARPAAEGRDDEGELVSRRALEELRPGQDDLGPVGPREKRRVVVEPRRVARAERREGLAERDRPRGAEDAKELAGCRAARRGLRMCRRKENDDPRRKPPHRRRAARAPGGARSGRRAAHRRGAVGGHRAARGGRAVASRLAAPVRRRARRYLRFLQRSRSASTIIRMRSSKPTVGFQPSFRRAFEGSARRWSTSAGRKSAGSTRTWSSQFKPTAPKATSQTSRTVWATPVPITKSSGSSCWSIRHIAST